MKPRCRTPTSTVASIALRGIYLPPCGSRSRRPWAGATANYKSGALVIPLGLPGGLLRRRLRGGIAGDNGGEHIDDGVIGDHRRRSSTDRTLIAVVEWCIQRRRER